MLFSNGQRTDFSYDKTETGEVCINNYKHSHAVCAARNAQQACSHSYLGTYFISMQTF